MRHASSGLVRRFSELAQMTESARIAEKSGDDIYFFDPASRSRITIYSAGRGNNKKLTRILSKTARLNRFSMVEGPLKTLAARGGAEAS